MIVGLLWHHEIAVGPLQGFAGEFGLIGPEGCAVDTGGVGLVGGAVANGGGDLDQAGFVADGLGGFQGPHNGLHIRVAFGHVLHMPAVRLVALEHVFGEGDGGVAVDGDVVVVVEGNQLAQAEMASQRGCLGGHSLLIAAVTHQHVGGVVDQGVSGLVEASGQVGFGDGQTHGVGDALTQGACGDLHARGFKGLGVTRRLGAPLAKLLDVLQGHRVVAGEVQQGVEQHASVTSGEHKPVTVEPVGVFGVVPQHLVP